MALSPFLFEIGRKWIIQIISSLQYFIVFSKTTAKRPVCGWGGWFLFCFGVFCLVFGCCWGVLSFAPSWKLEAQLDFKLEIQAKFSYCSFWNFRRMFQWAFIFFQSSSSISNNRKKGFTLLSLTSVLPLLGLATQLVLRALITYSPRS